MSAQGSGGEGKRSKSSKRSPPAWVTTQDKPDASLVLVLPLPPSGNHAHAPAKRRSKRGRVFMGKRLTDEAVEYRKAVRIRVLAARRGQSLFRGPVRLSVHYVLPDWRRRDMDNLEKQLQDALTGVAWEDDCQVTEGAKTKHVERGESLVVVSIWRSSMDGTKWPLWAWEAVRASRPRAPPPGGWLDVPAPRNAAPTEESK